MDIQERVLDIVRDIFADPEDVSVDFNYKDKGDELDCIEVVLAIEDEFGIDQIPNSDAEQFQTPKDIIEYVQSIIL